MGQFADKGHEQLYGRVFSCSSKRKQAFKESLEWANQSVSRLQRARVPNEAGAKSRDGPAQHMQRARHRREPGCMRALTETAGANLHNSPFCAELLTTSIRNRVVISHPGTGSPFARPLAPGGGGRSNENMFYSTFCLLAAPS
jgi:hypothetical protein